MRLKTIQSMGRTEWSLLIVLSALWGGSFFFGEIAVRSIPPFVVVLGRVGFAAMALLAVVYATGLRMPKRVRTWRAFLVMGALNNVVPFSLIFWGQTQIDSGLAAILNATTPLFTVVLAHIFTTDEKLTPGRLCGVALGVAGVAVMIGPDVLTDFGLEDIAQLGVLAAALSYAVAGLYGRRFAETPPLVTATGQLCASTMIIFPVAMIVDNPWTMPVPDLAAWGAIAGLALFCTALAYFIYFRILATAGASNLLLVTFLIPVSAILLGVTFLGEQLSYSQGLGMAIIAAGLVAIDGRLGKLTGSRRSG